jgi:hypothetical protein
MILIDAIAGEIRLLSAPASRVRAPIGSATMPGTSSSVAGKNMLSPLLYKVFSFTRSSFLALKRRGEASMRGPVLPNCAGGSATSRR